MLYSYLQDVQMRCLNLYGICRKFCVDLDRCMFMINILA